MKIDPKFIAAVRQAKKPEDLFGLIQHAIELEHATIPPYLCGYFTLKLDTNTDVGDIIRSVAVEEMLHMSIACNLLLAIGGSPVINKPAFVPSYPESLPFGIGTQEEPDGSTFKIHLRKCSKAQVQDTFMKIEEPEEPIDIPDDVPGRLMTMHFDTIGAFYKFLGDAIKEMGNDIFVPGAYQMINPKWFPENELFPIVDVDTALRAIDIIVDQGEGTGINPFDENGEPAHYYRFEEIIRGKRLVRTGNNAHPFAFSGDPVDFDEDSVWDMDENPKIANYKPGSRSERMAIQFSYSYTRALNALHDAFNG
ncbi:MAG: ferritin-like domain-containing protein, partial [Planktomarina sp.]